MTESTKSLTVNLLISLASVVITLGAIEGAARLYKSVPLFDLRDFRGQVRDLYKEGLPVQFDAQLGWIPKIGYSATSNKWGTQVTILDYGVRSNGNNTVEKTPPVLVVGDSFTFGDEVSDHETWPAILEQRLDKKVINAGVFAYGVDQSYLRLKSLLPVYSPDAVVFSFILEDILRAEYSVALGVQKPYFDIREGRLSRRNTPVEEGTVQPPKSWLHEVSGYSFVVHHIMMKLNPAWWLTGRRWSDGYTGISGGEITCLIFKELEQLAGQSGIGAVYILVQDTLKEPRPALKAKADYALGCVNQDVVKVIDLRTELAAVKEKDPDLYKSFFKSHMTEKGNAFVADTIAAAMR